jgi:amino acid adenylation domain-containing protein
MNISELLSLLHQRGISLEIDQGILIINAPKGALTDELKDRLKEMKEELISFLPTQHAIDFQVEIPKADRSKPIPASSSQRGLWFQYLLEGLSSTYNVPFVYQLRGKLNIPVLEKSLQYLIARHECLRMSFNAVEGEPYIVISERVEWKVNIIRSCMENIEREIAEQAAQPFKLEQAPLFRAHLWTDFGERHILLLNFHHIITDGWSNGIIERELSSMYAGIISGNENVLPPLEMDFADYASWQNDWLKTMEFAKELDYWTEVLHGAPELLDLPKDHPRLASQTYRGNQIHAALEMELVNKLRDLARRENVTLFMLMNAAFAILLSRFSRQEDIIIGVPMANRMLKELEGVVGFFVNTLPMRLDLQGNPLLADLLRQVRQVALGAITHQRIPFDKLVNKLQPQRDLGFNPIFQAVFNFQSESSQDFRLGECDVQGEITDIARSKFDLNIQTIEQDHVLNLELHYNTDLFELTTAERMLASYKRILEWMITNPTGRICEFSLLSSVENQQILVEWNETKRDFPSEKSVHELVEEQIFKHPDHTAVIFGEQHLSYCELNEKANRIAHRLRKMGARRDKPVGIYLERSAELIVAILGTLKAGSPYVPLDTLYPEERRVEIISDSGLEILVTVRALISNEIPGNLKLMILDEDRDLETKESKQNPENFTKSGDLVYIIYTSGSTGRPKGVEITHRNLVNCIISAQERIGLSDDDLSLTVTTPTFDISAFEYLEPLCTGATVVIASKEEASDSYLLVKKIMNLPLTWMFATPATWQMLVDANWPGKPDLKILCGGDTLRPDLADRLMQTCREVYNLYGPTEATIMCTSTRLQLGQPVTIGRPLDNTMLYVLDTYLKPVPVGVVGELFVGGEGLARGYHNRHETTAEKFIPVLISGEQEKRLYATGDLVRYRENGDVEIVGRKDGQVKIRGYRIELGEVEAKLEEHYEVEQAIVALSGENSASKSLVAYIVPNSKAALESEKLREFLKGKLPNYMIPSAFIVMESFPITVNGKIDRNALPTPHKETTKRWKDVSLQNSVEAELVKIWKEVLGLTNIALDDDFFEVGGNSLSSIRVLAMIEEKLGVRLSVAEFFRLLSIRRLARAIQSFRYDITPWTAVVEIQKGGAERPLYIVHGGDGTVTKFVHLARALGEVWPIYGLQAAGQEGDMEPDTTIEQMAYRYIEAIKTIQPIGPYQLAGFSGGGVIAYEMACQLNALKEQVSLLAEIDGYASTTQNKLRFDLFRRLFLICQNIPFWLKTYSQDEISNLGQRILGEFGRLRRLRKISVKDEAIKHTHDLVDKFEHGLTERQKEIYHLQIQAINNYQPKPYPGRVDVFSARWLRPHHALFASIDPKRGWDALALGGVKVHSSIGDHLSFILPPYVSDLAAKLRRILERAKLE